MPARHKPSFLSTAEWNQSGERIRSRLNEGPHSHYLLGAIIRALRTRYERSARTEDKYVLHLIDQLTIHEDRIQLKGGDLLAELDKPHQGVFGPIFDALTTPQQSKPKPGHDALMVSVQYDLLWTHDRDYPFPRTDAKSQRAWLSTQWKPLDQLLRRVPCQCTYSTPDAKPPTLTFPTAPKDLFLDLLAHLHGNSSESIKHLLRPPARRKS
ncbi:MAG: hypothetical protein ACT4PN_18280 [Nitrospiraceae bacterium]